MEHQLKNILLSIKDVSRESATMQQLQKQLTQPIKLILCREVLSTYSSKHSLVVADDVQLAKEWKEAGFSVLFFIHKDNEEAELGDFLYLIQGFEDVSNQYFERIFRRFRQIPWDILETKRCFLTETTVDDVEDFYRIYQEPSITEYMENLFEDIDEERAYTESYIQNVYNFMEFGIWTVRLKETGKIIGRAGLDVREGFEEPELGFVIEKNYQGQGIAYEVCSAILQYAKEELEIKKVLSFVKKGNYASVSLLKKLGFGYAKDEMLDQEVHECFCIELTESE